MNGRFQRFFGPAAVLLIGAGTATALWPEPPPDPAGVPEMPVIYAALPERVETHVLERGMTLSDVFSRAAIGGSDFAELMLGLRAYINPRRLVDGAEVTIRRWAQSGQTRFVELRVNPDTTVRLAWDPTGWLGTLVLTPVEVDTIYAAGAIDQGRTLFETMVYDPLDDVPIKDRVPLVYRLADIFEFKLDFTREVQPGDTYRLVYEREARPDGTARAQRILVAEIVNQGRAYAAVHFAAGPDGGGYYDAEGRPVTAGFSRYPVDFRITSSFSTRRYHPVLGIYRAHNGTDFGAPSGTPVQATADGTIRFAGWSGSYGNLIRITHANGYETRYAHLSRFARGVRPGTKVQHKQVVAYVGATGLATGAHLHYELHRGGRPINARTARLPEAPPISDAYLAAFLQLADTRFTLLSRAVQRGRSVPAARSIDGAQGH